MFIQLQHRMFSFNDYIHSTSTRALFIQQICSFNFNRAIFVQEEYLFDFNAQSYIFMEQTYLFNFNKSIFIQQFIYCQLFASSRTSTKLHLPYPFLKKKSVKSTLESSMMAQEWTDSFSVVFAVASRLSLKETIFLL